MIGVGMMGACRWCQMMRGAFGGCCDGEDTSQREAFCEAGHGGRRSAPVAQAHEAAALRNIGHGLGLVTLF